MRVRRFARPGPARALPLVSSSGVSGDVEVLQQAAQYLVRIEVGLGNFPRGARVCRIVARYALDRVGGLFEGGECQQSGIDGIELPQAAVLGNDRPAAGQVADAAVTEP